MAELLDYTERRTRAELAALPHGVYEAEGSVDTDGYTDEPVRLQARVEISPGRRRLRPRAARDPQRRAPVNSTYAQTFSACAYALKCLIDPDLPVNDGFYRLVSLDAPRGSVTNCTWPSPVVGGWETQTRLVDVIFRALLPALPERLPAGTKAMMCHAGFGGVDPQTASTTASSRPSPAATAAASRSDGPDAVQTHGQNTENAPVEETELNYPVRVARLSLVDDSDGAGPLPRRPRPAQGLPLRPADDLHGPRRPHGARAGGRVRRPRRPSGRVRARSAAARRRGSARRRRSSVEAGRHDQLPHVRRRRLRAAGGARSRARARDVREGKVALERARDVYGWRAVDPITFEVIRNALVAATDEMVLALKRSAYSTNIKTRSDFSCAFFDARAAVGRAGIRAARAPRLDGRAGAEGRATLRRREPRRRAT